MQPLNPRKSKSNFRKLVLPQICVDRVPGTHGLVVIIILFRKWRRRRCQYGYDGSRSHIHNIRSCYTYSDRSSSISTSLSKK